MHGVGVEKDECAPLGNMTPLRSRTNDPLLAPAIMDDHIHRHEHHDAQLSVAVWSSYL
jgi:hypothetical protein